MWMSFALYIQSKIKRLYLGKKLFLGKAIENMTLLNVFPAHDCFLKVKIKDNRVLKMKIKQAVLIYSVYSLFYHLAFMTFSNSECFHAFLTLPFLWMCWAFLYLELVLCISCNSQSCIEKLFGHLNHSCLIIF